VSPGAATPLERGPVSLSGRRDLWLKREDVHELGSFKWRGALPVVTDYRARGVRMVVTASTGNHGAATAWAASQLGLSAVVFVPEAISATKLAHAERFGAELRRAGHDLDQAKENALAFAESKGFPFFEDGAERVQYDGYRSIAAEILVQLERPPAAVIVPVGNGALLGGVGLELCERCHDVERIGVVAASAPAMAESWEAGRPVAREHSDTFADGLAVRVAIPLAVSVLGEVASRMLRASERAIAHAVAAFAHAGIRAEGAAAAALAALDQVEMLDGPIVLVLTGRNIDDELYRRAIEEPESFPDDVSRLSGRPYTATTAR
jgi:threonine dehydratase